MTELEMKEYWLSQVDEHIATAKEIITNQRKRIERLTYARRDTTQAEIFFVVFRETLQKLNAHRERILHDLEEIRREDTEVCS